MLPQKNSFPEADHSLRMRYVVAIITLLVLLGRGFTITAFSVVSLPSRNAGSVVDSRQTFMHLKPLYMAEDGENNESDMKEVKGFDGEGFAGYLLPYALTALAGLIVTGAFFKFVMMDY